MNLRYFSNKPNLETRAAQIWQILIGFAYNRQITTYKKNSKYFRLQQWCRSFK